MPGRCADAIMAVRSPFRNPPAMPTVDHRQQAQEYTKQLLSDLEGDPRRDSLRPLIEECESLARAIGAFHMEGIRFRMFNVDRLISRGGLPLPEAAPSIFSSIRRELEAAGFHTRSH